MSDFFRSGVAQVDPLINDALERKLHRQRTQIELVASENIVSEAVLDALAHLSSSSEYKHRVSYPPNRYSHRQQLLAHSWQLPNLLK